MTTTATITTAAATAAIPPTIAPAEGYPLASAGLVRTVHRTTIRKQDQNCFEVTAYTLEIASVGVRLNWRELRFGEATSDQLIHGFVCFVSDLTLNVRCGLWG